MKTKLKDYIEVIFTDAPDTHRARELKEEMYINLCEKYDDLIAEGKTPAAAYHAVISGVGDISELIEELKKETRDDRENKKENPMPPPKTERFYTSEEREAIRKYKNRCAVMTAFAVAMYILCWLPLVVLGALWNDVGGIVGLAVMFLMIAAATGLLIIQGMNKPECMRGEHEKDDDDDDDDDKENKKAAKHPAYRAISGAIWTLTVVVYFVFSFVFSAWAYSWLIFLISTAIDNIVKACFAMKS